MKTKKIVGTDRRKEGQTDGQDHVLSQADALTRNAAQQIEVEFNQKPIGAIICSLATLHNDV